jgi:hypothetical protein
VLVDIPTDLAAGTYIVQVASTGLTSNAVSVTVL